jgi:hypothetical protein
MDESRGSASAAIGGNTQLDITIIELKTTDDSMMVLQGLLPLPGQLHMEMRAQGTCKMLCLIAPDVRKWKMVGRLTLWEEAVRNPRVRLFYRLV